MTRDSLSELVKAVETLACHIMSARVPTAFLVLLNFHSCFDLSFRGEAR